MKQFIILTFMLLSLSFGVNAQEQPRVFSTEEQAIIDLSKQKWDWMAEKNVEKLASLFH